MYLLPISLHERHPCVVVVNLVDYEIVVRKFKLQSCYYNSLSDKGMNHLIPSALG